MSRFVTGLELAAAFYDEVVRPLVGSVRHSAALLGTGSDVLGFDTERSTDHDWGPRLQVFVAEADISRVRNAVDHGLPNTFRDWPTHYGWDDVPVGHHVEVGGHDRWLRARLGFDPLGRISSKDWLTVPQQVLLEVTTGAVFHDGLGGLTSARQALVWYPNEVWLWLLACQWRRIDQEEPFVGRTAEVGDELGSRIVAGRLVRDAVRLCFLQERRYTPYTKWLGTGFRELAARHNALAITAPVDENVGRFHNRPFRVLGSGRFVDACLERLSDPWLRSLPLTGAVDQFVDSADVLSESAVFPHLSPTFNAWGESATSP